MTTYSNVFAVVPKGEREAVDGTYYPSQDLSGKTMSSGLKASFLLISSLLHLELHGNSTPARTPKGRNDSKVARSKAIYNLTDCSLPTWTAARIQYFSFIMQLWQPVAMQVCTSPSPLCHHHYAIITMPSSIHHSQRFTWQIYLTDLRADDIEVTTCQTRQSWHDDMHSPRVGTFHQDSRIRSKFGWAGQIISRRANPKWK